jgi:hypothetical protein
MLKGDRLINLRVKVTHVKVTDRPNLRRQFG